MPRQFIRISAAAVMALGVAFAWSAPAAEDSLADGARKAGRAVGSTAHEAWQEGKKAGKEIGHGAAKAGRAAGKAAKEGALELKRAITGEK